MSASNEWTEWHLTPRGWERGNEKIDFGRIKSVPVPPDRVMTCKYKEFLASISQLDFEITTTVIWQCDNKNSIDKLIKKFGICPQQL